MSTMTLLDAVRSRRSVRGFLPDLVPKETLLAVFDLARWAPSGTNIQPWQVYVASGATRDTVRAGLMQRVTSGQPANPDHIGSSGRLEDPWRRRRRDCAKVLYDAMGIEWQDKAGRAEAGLRNFALFDAPHVAFLCMHERFGIQSAADVGMYAQTLMLSLTAHGLGSCAQGTMRNYPDFVREVFDLPKEIKVLFGISFGFEDPSIAANEARTTRTELGENVVFTD